MSFNILMDKLLIDLKILSKVPENGKLNTVSGNQLYMESTTFYQGIMRFMKGDSRNKTIERIEELINTSKQIAVSILQNSTMNIYEKNTTISKYEINEFNKYFEQLKCLSNELKNSQQGLKNLKNTYDNDANITSKLEVIIENIKRLIIDIESGLENKLPKENSINNYLQGAKSVNHDDNYTENFEIETQIDN
jgi:hypothetical protein